MRAYTIPGDRLMHHGEVERAFGVRLKPCPFCVCSMPALYMGPIPHVTCTRCGADGPPIERERLEDRQAAQHAALRSWNNRL